EVRRPRLGGGRRRRCLRGQGERAGRAVARRRTVTGVTRRLPLSRGRAQRRPAALPAPRQWRVLAGKRPLPSPPATYQAQGVTPTIGGRGRRGRQCGPLSAGEQKRW